MLVRLTELSVDVDGMKSVNDMFELSESNPDKVIKKMRQFISSWTERFRQNKHDDRMTSVYEVKIVRMDDNSREDVDKVIRLLKKQATVVPPSNW